MSKYIKGSVGMNYKVYKMKFHTAVHFGNGKLTSSDYVLHADTIFSALCIEALKIGGEGYLNELVGLTKNNQIRISDALPFIEDTLYMPKPMLQIQKEETGNSIIKKAYKKLKYIPIEALDIYLQGDLMPEEENNKLKKIGRKKLLTKAAVCYNEEADPYGVELFQFGDDSGLYIIIGYEEQKQLFMLEELIDCLSYTGVGGKISAGYGKFSLHTISEKKIPKGLFERLNKEGMKRQITLSVSMAKDEELEIVLNQAQYMLLKRSGYIQSAAYAETQLKKKDFFMFEAGSCFLQLFEGDVFDVSHEGRHPVYRYAKPMFIGVSDE